MNILLIEDSKTLRRIIGGYVEDDGHTLIMAETGEIALQLLETHQFDLILSDVDMPGLSGFDTVALMREMLGEHWIPIIFLTSRDDDGDYIDGFAAGSDDYIVKPVREVVLKAKIRVMERFINLQNKVYELINQPESVSQFDKLTQTYNSHTFLHMAGIQWSVLSRRKEPVSFLIIDVDYLSEYKNTYGKEKRDVVLTKVAKAIQSAAQRPNDFVGRLHKNDFVVMLPATEKKGANLVAYRIFENIEALNIEHRNSPLSGIVSASVAGMTSSSLDDISMEVLLNKATELLHKVKFSADDPVCVLDLNH